MVDGVGRDFMEQEELKKARDPPFGNSLLRWKRELQWLRKLAKLRIEKTILADSIAYYEVFFPAINSSHP